MTKLKSDALRGRVQRHVVVYGHKVAIDADVLLWTDTGLEFKAGDGARRRNPKRQVDLGVVHWTGSENDIPTLFRTLDTRELGVEFAIDKAGVIWQFCDPALIDTFDAGVVNPRSWGVEVVCYGHRKLFSLRNPDSARPTYNCRLHGKTFKAAEFNHAQLQALHALCNAMATAFPSMPRQVPVGPDRLVLNRAMRPDELRDYRGVVGHFHITNKKVDPGLQPIEFLKEKWG
jgi:N-acetyl-anhydromuramyl-L-alanine amidase AmpD